MLYGVGVYTGAWSSLGRYVNMLFRKPSTRPQIYYFFRACSRAGASIHGPVGACPALEYLKLILPSIICMQATSGA